MSAYELVSRLGRAVESVGSAGVSVPRLVRDALSVRRYVAAAAATVLVYVLLYLLSIGDLDISTSGRFDRFASVPSAEVLPGWQEKAFAERAPFLYEPVAAVYVLPQLVFFVSVGNLLIASGLGLLLGVNVALALHAVTRVATCRRRGVATSALGTLPTFLMGFACCAPSFLLALGANVAAALVPFIIPLRVFLLPLAAGFMVAMLVWSARRIAGAERELSEAGERVLSSARRGVGPPRQSVGRSPSS